MAVRLETVPGALSMYASRMHSRVEKEYHANPTCTLLTAKNYWKSRLPYNETPSPNPDPSPNWRLPYNETPNPNPDPSPNWRLPYNETRNIPSHLTNLFIGAPYSYFQPLLVVLDQTIFFLLANMYIWLVVYFIP